jgi:hypothetical protein
LPTAVATSPDPVATLYIDEQLWTFFVATLISFGGDATLWPSKADNRDPTP